MPKLRLIGLTLLALSATAVSHAEETRYVSDELNTWVRSGPGDHYRLVGTVNAGEEVTLLQTDANTNYAQVKDSSGRTAWIPLKQLSTEPSLRSRVPDLENQVKTLTDKLTNIDNTWNQRTAEMQQKVAQSDSVINGLKEENQKLKNELIVAQKRSMPPAYSWMTNSAPSSCNGLCMAAACWGLACCSVWYCRT